MDNGTKVKDKDMDNKQVYGEESMKRMQKTINMIKK